MKAERRKALIKEARNQYQTHDCEIDDDAKVSEAKESGGAWIAAWVWINDAEAKDERT